MIMGILVAVVGSGLTIYTILTYPFPQTTSVTELPGAMEYLDTVAGC